MNRKQPLLTILILFLITSNAFAYFEDYPPYKFKEGAPKHLEITSLIDLDKEEYKDSQIVARLIETSDTLDFIIQEGNTILTRMEEKETPIPYAVYWADLDGNGLKDFIVFSSYRGVGFGAYGCKADIFLKRADGSYQKISYDTLNPGLEDFVDLDKDGKYEVIITDMNAGDKHNYFTYDIYEFKDDRLKNANSKFKGFPKFIWYTDKPNDKDTTHLTKEERDRFTKEKDAMILYGK